MLYRLTAYLRAVCPTAGRLPRNRQTKRLIISIVVAFLFCGLLIFCARIHHCQIKTFPFENVTEIISEIENKGKSVVRKINPLPNGIRIVNACSDKCKFLPNAKIPLLVVVKSYIGHFDQRLIIRRTWGNESQERFIIAFMVGQQAYAQPLLEFELSMFHDIVQGSFEDTYDNNIMKTLTTYKWIVEFCTNVTYVLFIDDDCLVNIEKLLNAIDVEESFKNNISMYGFKLSLASPLRDLESKWYVSYNEYSGSCYPPYLTGAAILTDIRVIKKFNMAFPYVKNLHIDDVYLGIVAKLLDIPLIHDGRFSINKLSAVQMKNSFTSHGYGKRGSLLIGWQKLNNFRKV